MNEKDMVIRVKITRERALAMLAFLFLAWHPGVLNSESLTLTTYYPAPYGGYVSLLTTGLTLLARDSSRVGIGTGTDPLNTNHKLTVSGGAIGGRHALTPGYASFSEYGTGDGGAAIYNDNATYKSLMVLGNNSAGTGLRIVSVYDDLGVSGDVRLGGAMRAVCELRAYTNAAVSYCGGSQSASAMYTIVAIGDSLGRIQRTTFDGGTNYTYPFVYPPLTSGIMTCCKNSIY